MHTILLLVRSLCVFLCMSFVNLSIGMHSLPLQFPKEKPSSTIRLLMTGDVNDKPGMEVIKKYVSTIKSEFVVDLTIINSDNSAGGLGTTLETASELFSYGADILTGGNHIFDKPSIYPLIDTEKRILRPHNLLFATSSSNVPGSGIHEITIKGKKIIVMHLLGQKDMSQMLYVPSESERLQIANPFTAADLLLQRYKLIVDTRAVESAEKVNGIFIDFHAQSPMEKRAFSQYLDGRVSAVIGTHCHIPTFDWRVSKKGTAFQSDIGMCGVYDSVLGMESSGAISSLFLGDTNAQITSASGTPTFCGSLIDIDSETGFAKRMQFIQIGGDVPQISLF